MWKDIKTQNVLCFLSAALMDVQDNNYYRDIIFNQKDRMTEWIRKQQAMISCLKNLTLALKIYEDRKWRDGKSYFK